MHLMKNEIQILKSSAEILNLLADDPHRFVINNISGAKLYRYNTDFYQKMNFNGHWLKNRQGFIVEINFNDGKSGFGEASPLPGFSLESLDQCEATLRQALTQLVLGNLSKSPPCAAKFAIECALLKIPFEKLSPQAEQTAIPLLFGDKSTILTKYQGLNKPAVVKLKVARNPIKHDVEIIFDLLAVNKNLTFNLDANQAWSLSQASEFSALIPSQVINYIEEPCHDLITSLTFANTSQTAIALDETLQVNSFKFQPNKWIKALVLKPTLIGSLSRCITFAKQAKQNRIGCYFSSSFESSLGVHQLQYIANKLAPKQATGFDTLETMYTDIIVSSSDNKPLITKDELECICQF